MYNISPAVPRLIVRPQGFKIVDQGFGNTLSDGGRNSGDVFCDSFFNFLDNLNICFLGFEAVTVIFPCAGIIEILAVKIKIKQQTVGYWGAPLLVTSVPVILPCLAKVIGHYRGGFIGDCGNLVNNAVDISVEQVTQSYI
jgi:hypothetical protein